MKQKRLRTLLVALCFALLFSTAAAEETAGDLPSLGLIVPFTAQESDMGLALSAETTTLLGETAIQLLLVSYTDQPLLETYRAQYAGTATSDMEAAMLEAELQNACTIPAAQLLLLPKDTYTDLTAGGAAIGDVLGIVDTFVLGENEGYVYVGFDYAALLQTEDAALGERLTAACAQARVLLTSATFQPIVQAAAPANPFPTFTTTDLNGNTVTSDLFAAKDLTVVNVWGTYCSPCIEEMDELAAWSDAMPDNVQLVGLVCDLYTPDDAETLETAQMICEMTGATNYPSLIANVDLAPLLMDVTGVPTTFFVDSTGNIVGTPIVGANVQGCMAFVEEYLNAK